jgi:hypothetical protein
MKFDRIVRSLLQEAGVVPSVHLANTDKSRDPKEAKATYDATKKRLERTIDVLKTHSDRKGLYTDLYNDVRLLISIAEKWGKDLGLNEEKVTNAIFKQLAKIDTLNIKNFKGVSADDLPPYLRGWFYLFANYVDFKPRDRSSFGETQAPRASEIYYWGSDGKPYVTRLSFNEENMISGRLFYDTNRFAGKPITNFGMKPVWFKGGNKNKSIEIEFAPSGKKANGEPKYRPNSTVEDVFGQPEISKDELQKLLRSKDAEKEFPKRAQKEGLHARLAS